MDTPLSASYQAGYVALSYAVSVLGGFVALTAAQRIRQADGSIRAINSWAAGFALGGIGVWSMHFIGMVALSLPAATSYSTWETVVSLLAGIVGSARALGYVARDPHRVGRLLGAGIVLGMGVVAMHYLGMYGMKIAGYIRWDLRIVAASAVIAIIAATAALWLAFNTTSRLLRAAAAVVMGFAVCTMHYTGMAAAEFICTGDPSAAPQGFGYFSADRLPAIIAIVAVVTAVMIMVYEEFQGSRDDPAEAQVLSRIR